ncbi:hypothetical protein PUN4_510023 [Paraburkholderia unamae]|nr:hypothetical protein PUN4_510023 [Paraburkholderia unamae]
MNSSVTLTIEGTTFTEKQLSLLAGTIDCCINSPIMPGGEEFLEYDAMTCRVHPMSGQREVLPDTGGHGSAISSSSCPLSRHRLANVIELCCVCNSASRRFGDIQSPGRHTLPLGRSRISFCASRPLN